MSTSGTPALVIPIQMDGAEALAELAKLKDALKKLGQDGQEGTEKTSSGIKGIASSLKDLAVGYAQFTSLKAITDAVAGSFKQTSEYVQSITKEFVELRGQMQQIAALTNRTNEGKFTVEQSKAAAKASLTPQEWIKFQEQFQSYAGAYLEGDQRKLSDKDAEKYQQAVAEFAKARGISPSEAAQAAGGVLQFAEGPISADEALARFGRGYKTLERAPTPVPQLLPQTSRLMAQGSTFEESAQLLGIQSEANPGEEGTHVENVLRGLRENLLKGKGDELGISKGMSPLQMIRAASEKLASRIDAGENQDELVGSYFNDPREFKGMTGFISRGVRAGGFDRVAGYVQDAPADFVSQANRAYEKSKAGQSAKETAELARAKTERGARFEDVALIRQQAERELTEEGRFEQTHAEDIIDEPLRLMGGDDARTRAINERSLKIAREQSGQELTSWDDVRAGWQGSTDETIRAMLEEQKEQTRLMKEDRNKPLAAPPPNPPLRAN